MRKRRADRPCASLLSKRRRQRSHRQHPRQCEPIVSNIRHSVCCRRGPRTFDVGDDASRLWGHRLCGLSAGAESECGNHRGLGQFQIWKRRRVAARPALAMRGLFNEAVRASKLLGPRRALKKTKNRTSGLEARDEAADFSPPTGVEASHAGESNEPLPHGASKSWLKTKEPGVR